LTSQILLSLKNDSHIPLSTPLLPLKILEEEWLNHTSSYIYHTKMIHRVYFLMVHNTQLAKNERVTEVYLRKHYIFKPFPCWLSFQETLFF